MALPYVEAIGDGLFVIDTGFIRPRFDASFLIVERGRAAFVDTGTRFAVPRLLAALSDVGLAPQAVDYVIATHVHLDHAGGVGPLLQALPNARLLVHPRGARHLIDPSQLYQGALAVYGQAEMDRAYGRLVGVDAGRVTSPADGQTIALAGRPLLFIDTPGHARHHHCVWDERSQGWFTGDTFGLSYREFDTANGAWTLPAVTPVQFDPVALKESMLRLLARSPRCMYLTHFGRVDDVPRLADLLFEQIDAMVALARDARDAPDRHAALKAELARLYRERLLRHGVADIDRAMALLTVDIELNAQGLGVWLERDER